MMHLAGREVRHHALLVIVVLADFDPDLRAYPRIRTVRTHYELRTQSTSVAELELRAIRIESKRLAFRRRDDFDAACPLQRLPQRLLQATVFNDECELTQTCIVSAEIEPRARVV